MRRFAIRTLRIVGEIWLAGGVLLIAASYGLIAIFDGIERLWEIASPLNMVNTLTMIGLLLPGYGLMKLAERLGRG